MDVAAGFGKLKRIIALEDIDVSHRRRDTQHVRVHTIGLNNSDSMKTHIPHDLSGMIILEDETGRQFLVRSKAIRMTVIEPETEGTKGKA